MTDEPTCGKGLAGNSLLPAKLGELTAAVGAVLEHHMTALDMTDANSRREREVYAELVARHRAIASQLAATAKQMASYRDLPMGRHDQKVMSGAKARQVFEAFVRHEAELAALLQERLERDRTMLQAMAEANR